MVAPVFGPLPQNLYISKPRYVVDTSNSSIHFHSVAIGAARRLSRRMRVQILTHATEEGVIFLVTFQTQRRAWMLTSRISSISESRLSDVTSQPLSPLHRAIATNTFVWFQEDSFLGHNLCCMNAYALKTLASLDLNYYVACVYSCSLTLALKTRFL